MTDDRDKPTDAENKARAVERWANDGGAPAPVNSNEAHASGAAEPEAAPEAEALERRRPEIGRGGLRHRRR